MRSTKSLFVVAALITAAAACDSTEETTAEPATFDAVMQQVIAPRCTFSSCHANPTVAASLDLSPERACDTLVNQPSCLFPDRPRIVPGSPEDSFFFHKLTGQGLDEQPTGNCGTQTNLLMPFGARALEDDELQLVHDWIAAGASCASTAKTDPGAAKGPVVASLAASRTAPVPGEAITITVTLDKAAPEGGQMVALEMDTAALSAPVQVVVPAGSTSTRFEAYAVRPTSRFPLRASTTDGSRELTLRVAGLEIAEVLSDPLGDDDQLQWVKLHNTGHVSIDLAGYQLKAGLGSYDLVSVDLTGSIPAGGCVVIGGPLQSGQNSEPIFSQLVNFSPDLPHSAIQAAGFAVFDGGASLVGGISTPVDAMIIGANNEAKLLGPDAEIPAPYCGTPLAGLSALRTGAGTCVSAQMQPRACE
ncbi:MAG TPA: lamin tail domain-containing protein [Kofleriaceae bacterium]|nr:lamin tail domain-containing protein [Kofleriaceae bacterium]